MKLLDLTLATPAENLSLDEALLDAAEAEPARDEVLRLWEPPRPLVVVGRSSNVEREVNVGVCRQRGVPIFRRASGGAAIVAGPGCLMYAVVLSYARHPELRMLDRAHEFVLTRVASGLWSLGLPAQLQGTSDLVIESRKVSGNSLRCKRDHLLYHGTLLYDFDLTLVGELLRMPPRQPEYRAGRPHGQFVANLPVGADSLRVALASAFAADKLLDNWPLEQTASLVASRYGRDDWNARP
jgi:lipoate-protein ligase A